MSDNKSLNNFKKTNNNFTRIIFQPQFPLTEFYNQTLTGDYLAAGINLLGTTTGNIDITGLIPSGSSIETAFLYWGTRRRPSDPPNTNLTFNGTNITGQFVAALAGGFFDAISANVTTLVINGINTITNFPTFTDGASLVIIYSNPSSPRATVIINEGAVAFASDIVSTTFANFVAGGLPVTAKTTYIVGGGAQNPDTAIFNNQTVASPNPFHNNWDTLTIDVSNLINSGDTTAQAAVTATNDVLSWVVQVLRTTVPVPPVKTRGIKIF